MDLALRQEPKPMFEESPVFQMACRQLDRVAEVIDIDPGVLERLSQPKRALVVSVPIRMDDGRTESFVGYRVQEQLATVGAATAVGRTSDVTGTMTIDGTTITAVDVTADLTTLQSDEANRDRQLQRQGLETATFPTATFTLTQPIELDAVPADGEVVDATATGDLTLHGVTQSVEIPLQARIDGGVITVAGMLPIQFADYDIAQPQGMIVLSVEDHGDLELQLHFVRG